MNLIQNVKGPWETAKQLVRQDLDTIQRTVNQILGQINAPDAAAVVRPAIISPSFRVTVYGSDPLTTVAVGDGLIGNGTAIDPVSVDIVRAVTLTIGNAAIGTLFSVPVEIIAAPPAGYVIRVFDLFVRTRVGTGWGSNPVFSLIYSGDAGANSLAGGFQLPLGTAGFDKIQMTTSSTLASQNTSIANGVAVVARTAAKPAGAGTGCSREVVVRYGIFAI